MNTTSTTRVLVAGEPRFTDLYAGWLCERFDVHSAYSSEEAGGELTGRTDVLVAHRTVLCGTNALARALGGRVGPYVLAVFAARDAAVGSDDDPRTLSELTAVAPDRSLVAPVSKNAVLGAVQQLSWRARRDAEPRPR